LFLCSEAGNSQSIAEKAPVLLLFFCSQKPEEEERRQKQCSFPPWNCSEKFQTELINYKNKKELKNTVFLRKLNFTQILHRYLMNFTKPLYSKDVEWKTDQKASSAGMFFFVSAGVHASAECHEVAIRLMSRQQSGLRISALL
jgi:hypothetical protein